MKQETLSPEQARMIQLLIAGKTQEEAAKELDVSQRTVARWLTLPHVKMAYEEVKADIGNYVRDQIRALSSKAIAALTDCLDDADTPPTRLKAAQLVLDRVAPALSTEQLQPEQNGAIPHDLLQYCTNEELEQIDIFVQTLTARKAQAEADREKLRA